MLSAVPYLIATVAMVVVGRRSDRTGERRWHAAVALVVSGGGFLLSTQLMHSPLAALAALSIAWAGLKAAQGPFWALPPAFLSGTAAAGGIAVINSIANLGGQVGPAMAGYLERSTGGFSAGLVMSAILLLAAAALITTVPEPARDAARPSRPRSAGG